LPPLKLGGRHQAKAANRQWLVFPEPARRFLAPLQWGRLGGAWLHPARALTSAGSSKQLSLTVRPSAGEGQAHPGQPRARRRSWRGPRGSD